MLNALTEFMLTVTIKNPAHQSFVVIVRFENIIAGAQHGLLQTSKMESFETIVNSRYGIICNALCIHYDLPSSLSLLLL